MYLLVVSRGCPTPGQPAGEDVVVVLLVVSRGCPVPGQPSGEYVAMVLLDSLWIQAGFPVEV